MSSVSPVDFRAYGLGLIIVSLRSSPSPSTTPTAALLPAVPTLAAPVPTAAPASPTSASALKRHTMFQL
ncbi:uncharacterized protein PHACADRAFT_203905 [Phanerochaete carnosa HHB-10118-sp]|uniref:Uncharacterized protein n=1 Tax=Phanerochaete carnosa (strain HHB-10118-sp) TaxID=650164 RepID=K5WMS8_PHACS|nr:uncharacterized protein PHACADRAFT_203905 [Phanerochaete carnosa HHB-10118-sp]EKM60755.1 hypothetical protein PHACADRAFT_203905 [Phanerochaete carnosa HHB-10118-sp]